MYSLPITQILWKSACNFLSYPANKQADKQTDGKNKYTPANLRRRE